MGDLAKLNPLAGMAEAIAKNEQMRTAFGVLQSVNAGFSISSRDDAATAADTLAVLKGGERTAQAAITDAMRDYKQAEAHARATLVAPLTAGIAKVADEMNRWRRAEDQRVRQEQVRAEQAAAAAREAAAQQNATLTDDQEELPSAQVIVPQQEKIVRGAIGKTHQMKRVKAVELVDPLAAAKAWPSCLKLDDAMARTEYEILIKRGTADYPPEEPGLVRDGVRFVTTVTIVAGRA